MLAAWLQGAPTTESFGGVTLQELQASHDAIEAAEMDLKESLADTDLKRSALENVGRNAAELQRKVYLGVSVDLGEDSELLGAMGYVRKSERRSGLTRKLKSVEEPSSSESGDLDPSRN